MGNKLVDSINENIDSIEVILRINRDCNQKCLFCFVENSKKTNFTYEEVVAEVLKITKRYKWKNIEFVITWWEPTINPDFFAIIDYLWKNWEFIRLQTNAVFFWIDKNLEKMKPYLEKTNLFISFHSHNEKLYDHITQSKWQFPLAVKWIKNLFKCNYLELNIVINKLNIDHFVHYIEFIWKTFWNKWNYYLNISTLTNMNNDNKVWKLSVSYSKIVKTINKSELIIKKYNINIAMSFWAPSDLPFCIWNKVFYFKDECYTKARLMSDRIKFSFCKKCNYNDYCNWILKVYIEKYWNGEFKPIVK